MNLDFHSWLKIEKMCNLGKLQFATKAKINVCLKKNFERGLCLMKLSKETLQTLIVFFAFHFEQLWIFTVLFTLLKIQRCFK